MPYDYSAEHHDWDMTLRSASELYKVGVEARDNKDLVREFAALTGSMMLSFSAIESFCASIAFSMGSDARYPSFDRKLYLETGRFWDRMAMLMEAAGIAVDKSKGLFQRISAMQDWRNLVAHADPYEIPTREIATPAQAKRQHTQAHRKAEYARCVNAQCAKDYYTVAYDFIKLVMDKTGFNPRASVSYTPT